MRVKNSRVCGGGGLCHDTASCASVPHIYAVGDVTNRVNLTPMAIREGQAFADTLSGHPSSPCPLRLPPLCPCPPP